MERLHIKRESTNFHLDIICLKRFNSIFISKTFYSSTKSSSLLFLSINKETPEPYGSGVSLFRIQRYLTITNLYSDCITR